MKQFLYIAGKRLKNINVVAVKIFQIERCFYFRMKRITKTGTVILLTLFFSLLFSAAAFAKEFERFEVDPYYLCLYPNEECKVNFKFYPEGCEIPKPEEILCPNVNISHPSTEIKNVNGEWYIKAKDKNYGNPYDWDEGYSFRIKRSDGTWSIATNWVRVMTPSDQIKETYKLKLPNQSKENVKSLYNKYLKPYLYKEIADPLYVVAKNPYDTNGALTSEGRQVALNMTNFLRESVGVDAVGMTEENNRKAQAAAEYINSHPTLRGHNMADNDPSASQDAKDGLHGGNIGYQTSGPYMMMSMFFFDFTASANSNNPVDAGHRKNLLNPQLKSTGFGIQDRKEKGQNGGCAQYTKDVDYNKPNKTYMVPSPGDFPVELMPGTWSVNLNLDNDNGALINYPREGDIKITVSDSTGRSTELKPISDQKDIDYDWYKSQNTSNTVLNLHPYSLLNGLTTEQICNRTYTVRIEMPGMRYVVDNGSYVLGEPKDSVEKRVEPIEYTIKPFSIYDEGWKKEKLNSFGLYDKKTNKELPEYNVIKANEIQNLELRTDPEEAIDYLTIGISTYDAGINNSNKVIGFDWDSYKVLDRDKKNYSFMGLYKTEFSVGVNCGYAYYDEPKYYRFKVVESDTPGQTDPETNPDTPGQSDPSTNPSTPGQSDPSTNPNSPSTPSDQMQNAELVKVYRLYHEGHKEHLYTTDQNEVNVLTSTAGWKAEGVGWQSPKTGKPVYRLYSPVTRYHLFTTDQNEVNVLSTQKGWQVDNNSQPLFYSADSGVPVYRLYHEGIRAHLLTTDENEYNVLPGRGWRQENIAFYAVSK